jgi:DNA mismatch repair protein MutS
MESYGLHVARLAGLPEGVLRRAEEILEDLRQNGAALGRRKPEEPEAKGEQPAPETGETKEARRLLEELFSVDINAMTPLEALNFLSGWKERARSSRRPSGQQSRKRPSDSGMGSPSLFDNN